MKNVRAETKKDGLRRGLTTCVCIHTGPGLPHAASLPVEMNTYAALPGYGLPGLHANARAREEGREMGSRAKQSSGCNRKGDGGAEQLAQKAQTKNVAGH